MQNSSLGIQKKYARITLGKILERTKILLDDPYSGRIVPEVGIDTIRELIYSHYRIVYHIKSEAIFIIAVHHTAMRFNPGKIK